MSLRPLILLTFLFVLATSFEVPKGIAFDIDVDSVLNNKRLLDAYTKCFLDKGPCAGAPREMKKNFASIFSTNCSTCTKVQKKQVRSAFNKLREKKPQEFHKIFEKYNPGNTHLQRFLNWLKSNEL
ncbi:ejaculatory bulb-specific protein 3-like [Cimex lectularius]|uniref:Chemosensory protein n=1 Tax=Cimex lectularius TaxID=79782 RepID=A0A8I6RCF4_CIMLE|nr:ejaculatory bulb-specific protein 3-like [Cimex lectularius]